MDERNICQEALLAWGAQPQLMMLFEEMGELMQAVGKVERANGAAEYSARLEHLAEEIADVRIMLKQLELMYEVEDAVAEQTEYRLGRLKERLEDFWRRRVEEERAGGDV